MWEVGVIIKRQKRDPCNDGNVQYLGCTNINVLTVTLYYTVLVPCALWGKLSGKGCTGLLVLLLIIAYESTTILKQ